MKDLLIKWLAIFGYRLFEFIARNNKIIVEIIFLVVDFNDDCVPHFSKNVSNKRNFAININKTTFLLVVNHKHYIKFKKYLICTQFTYSRTLYS